MKKLLAVICILTVIALADNGQTVKKPFESIDGRFTVQMPGSDPTEGSANDGYIKNGFVTSTVGEATYRIDYRSYCDTFDKPELAAQQVQKLIAELRIPSDQPIISETDVVLENKIGEVTTKYPGKELQVESGSHLIKYRIYVTEDKGYRLSVTTDK